jgi:biopolymer transport protein ExbD
MKNEFQREELQAPLAEINMTPLVDIMLVLLVIFLITAPIINSAININLPKENARPLTDNKVITISITQDGQYFLEETKMTSQEIALHLQKIANENSQQLIHIRADESVAYRLVSKILAIAQNSGLNNISFITQN